MTRRQLTPNQMADLSGLMDELAHDPKTRPYIAKLVAHKFPDRARSFTDVAMADQIAGLRQEIANREYQRNQADIEAKANAEREKLVSSGYSKEQVDEIKAEMDKHHITDWDAGRVLYQHYHKPTDKEMEPLAAERPGATWEFPTVNGRDGKPIPFKDFAANPSAAANNAAYQAITEFKRSRVGFGGR